MNHRQKLLGYYNYTVVLTYIGMITGFIGIIYAFENDLFHAAICLIMAGFCDMFDGTIASTRFRTEQEKCFGIQIDSFSDLICFGVLPAAIVYSLDRDNPIILSICSLYLLCALIRLAYFNVDEQERQKHSSASREVYTGLPVTLSALFLPSVYGAANWFSWKPAVIPAIALLTMALLFLLPFPLRKPKLPGKICIMICGLLEVGFVVFTCGGI